MFEIHSKHTVDTLIVRQSSTVKRSLFGLTSDETVFFMLKIIFDRSRSLVVNYTIIVHFHKTYAGTLCTMTSKTMRRKAHVSLLRFVADWLHKICCVSEMCGHVRWQIQVRSLTADADSISPQVANAKKCC